MRKRTPSNKSDDGEGNGAQLMGPTHLVIPNVEAVNRHNKDRVYKVNIVITEVNLYYNLFKEGEYVARRNG